MIQTCKLHGNGPGARRALPSGAPYALPLTLGQSMWSSTDTSNASAEDELVAEEEDYDDEYDHDCRAQEEVSASFPLHLHLSGTDVLLMLQIML